MRRIIYTSIARKGLELSDCVAILKGAADNNKKLGITGVLLLSDETFLQYLEGPGDGIERTLAVIRRDQRHHHYTVLVVQDDAPAQRLFGQWRMGFHHLTAAEATIGSNVLRNDDDAPLLALQSAPPDDLCARLLRSFWGINAGALKPTAVA